MKKFFYIIGCFFLTSIIITTVLIINVEEKNKGVTKKVNEENILGNDDCMPLVGGGYDIIFHTNGGKKLDNYHVCIGCYHEYPCEEVIPSRDGYTFDGWYYDSKLNKKASNCMYEVEISPKYDDNNCQVGYNDIELYAKWIKNK